MRKRATARAVAEMAGVSKWTVIRAFTPGASIAPASRDKVLEAARNLNYSPNLLARSLATNLTREIAVFIDDFANPHKLPFLERLTSAAQAEGLVVMLININIHFDHVHALINADQRQVDAVVLFGTSFRDETLRDKRLGPGFPKLFVLARDSQIKDVPAINCDTELAMREICEYLDAKGYRRPAFMAGPRALSTALGRRRCFRDYWSRRDGPDLVEIHAERYSAQAGADAMRQFLSTAPPKARVDLIMCENDILACGAKTVICNEFGLSVPGDIGIVGFDNIELAADPAYGLTTYEQPTDEMVRATIDMILGRRPGQSVNFPGRFVPRSSA